MSLAIKFMSIRATKCKHRAQIVRFENVHLHRVTAHKDILSGIK